MFPIGNGFAYVVYLECAIIGLALGLVSGILTSVIMKLRLRSKAMAASVITAKAANDYQFKTGQRS